MDLVLCRGVELEVGVTDNLLGSRSSSLSQAPQACLRCAGEELAESEEVVAGEQGRQPGGGGGVGYSDDAPAVQGTVEASVSGSFSGSLGSTAILMSLSSIVVAATGGGGGGGARRGLLWQRWRAHDSPAWGRGQWHPQL